MDPDERAFYEGKHLEGPDEEEEDVAAAFKRQAEERDQRKAEEQATMSDAGSDEGVVPKKKKDSKKSVEPGKPKHPFDAVFGDQIAPLIVDKQKNKFSKYEQ